MVETIRYSQIYKEDLALGVGVKEIELNAGEVVQLTEINLSHLHDGDNSVLYASSDATVDPTFTFDPTNNRLRVPNIAGGIASGDDLRILSTTHATNGDVTIQENGGNVGIGIASPASLVHIQKAGGFEVVLEETSTGDPRLTFALSSVDQFSIGVDNSDSDKFKIEVGGIMGVNNTFVIDSSGNISLGTATADGKFHIFEANSSVTPQTDADLLIVESSSSNGMTFAVGTTATSSIRFSRSTSATAGAIQYDHSSDIMTFDIGAAERMRIDSNGAFLLGVTTADALMAGGGIQLEHDVSAGATIMLQDSVNVAHGITSFVSTQTYGYLRAISVLGGVDLSGFAESSSAAVNVAGFLSSEDTTTADTSTAAVQVIGRLKSGTSAGAMGATANVFTVRNHVTSVLLVKGDGDVANSGGSTAMTTYDDYNDVQLLQTIKGVMAPNYRNQLGAWVDGHSELLERTGVITRRRDGGDGYWISQRGWRGLLIDAIAQIDRRITALESTSGI